MNWKRILLILGFILLVIVFAVLLYFLFFAPKKPAPLPVVPAVPIGGLPTVPGADRPPIPPGAPTPPTPTPPVGLAPDIPVVGRELPPTAQLAQGGPVRMAILETNKNINPRLASDGKSLVTFDSSTGKAYRVTPNGVLEPLTDQSFAGAYNVKFSPQADKAVFQFPDTSNIVYDFTNKKSYVLPKHWDTFDFSPAGDQLAFKSLGDDPDNQWLAISNIDGTGARGIEHLGAKAGLFTPSWSPSDQIVGSFREGVDFNRQKIFFIGKNKENFRSMIIDGRGLEYIWSPDGDKILYSIYTTQSEYNPELWIIDAIGESIGNNKRHITVQTWAHKCTFTNNNTAYCAVPKELITGAGLLPSYGDTGEDEIYKLDLTTGTKTKIAEPSERHTISSIVVSKDETLLYFTDKDTGQIYKIDLK
ncbi:MAG: hypothetical protein AAB400_02590 [Patescibacteria group bacterium]